MVAAASSLQISCPFRAADVPDLRLLQRARVTMRALATGALHGRPATPAVRRGYDRWRTNRRLDAAALLAHSTRDAPAAVAAWSVVLSCEDSMYVRGDAPDAGPLRHGFDRGYVSHHAVAVVPGSGLPCTWLGGEVWTRAGAHRAQDHKTRPPADRESDKWSRLRRRLVGRLRAAGYAGRIISINDREGDAWWSLAAAVADGHELITRATQDRRLVGPGPPTLRRALRATPYAGVVTLRVHRRTATGAIATRVVRVQVRWRRVTLAPPRHDPFAAGAAPLTLVAIALREARPPRGWPRFQSRLLTTCPVAGLVDAQAVVGWYGDRWGVEVANDVLKNALEVEAAVGRHVDDVARALALAGPVAAQVAGWVARARATPDAPAATAFDVPTRATIAHAARYFGVTTIATATVGEVVATLGRIGGGDVRPTRPPGWRVVLRGWQRVEEFRRIKAFLRTEATARRSEPPDD
jgi:hypothetical protein